MRAGVSGMRGGRLPAAPGLRRASSAWLTALAVIVAVCALQMPATSAAFAGDTHSGATFSADVLQPPVNVRLAHTCTEVLGNIVAYYIDVAWDPSPTPYTASSRLWRATDPAGPWTALADVGTAMTYRDSTVALSTTYYYAVTAHYASWSSLRSVSASLTTKNMLCL